jgi:DNA polymerase III delta subunit
VIVLLYGANEMAIRRRLQELKDEADGGSGMVESNVNVIDGREAKPGEILAAVMSAPFLSAKRLVVVERIFERFEGRAGPERGLPKTLDPLITALEAGVPESTILVFLGLPFGRDMVPTEISEKNALVARLSKIPAVRNEHQAKLAGGALLEHIRAEAERRGLRFRPGKPADRLQRGERMPDESDPARLIEALCQADTLSIANELDKLVLYSDGGDVSVVEVNRVCAGERVSNNFQFRDAVLDGNLATACEYRDRLLYAGEELGGLLYGLMEAYRSVARLIDAIEDRLPPEEIGKLMGNAGRYPGLRDPQIRRVRAIGASGLKRAYELLVEADRTHKLGEVDEEVAFDILLARLCEIARPVTAPRRR